LTPTELVATTFPVLSVPRRALVSPVRYVFPDTVTAVDDAYGNVDATDVEVAMKYWAVGVVVATTPPLAFPERIEFVMPANVSAPVDEKLEVAVAPKYALLKTERIVEEAPPVNWWRAVQVGAIDWESAGAASLLIAVVAEPLTAVRPIVPVGLAKEVLPVPTHVPEIEKHPPARSMPLANVDVAAVPVTFRYVD